MTEKSDSEDKTSKTIGDFVALVAMLIIRRPYVAMMLVSGITGFTFWNMGAGVQGLSHARNWGARIDTLEYNVCDLKRILSDVKLQQDSTKRLEKKILITIIGLKKPKPGNRNALKEKRKNPNIDSLDFGSIGKIGD